MVLSQDGDHPMTKLSDTQAVSAGIEKRYAVLLRRRGFTPGGDLLFRGRSPVQRSSAGSS
jgi:hypothetical protein